MSILFLFFLQACIICIIEDVLSKFLDFYFINFWLCWVFVAAKAFLYLWRAGAALRLKCAGFSLQWLLVTEHRL